MKKEDIMKPSLLFNLLQSLVILRLKSILPIYMMLVKGLIKTENMQHIGTNVQQIKKFQKPHTTLLFPMNNKVKLNGLNFGLKGHLKWEMKMLWRAVGCAEARSASVALRD